MISPDEQIRDLRAEMLAEIAELKQFIHGRPKYRKRGSPVFSIRCTYELRAAVNSYCRQRNVTVSSLLAQWLEQVVNDVSISLTPKTLLQNRLKPTHFSDGKTNTTERDAETAREDAARRAVFHAVEGAKARRELDIARIPHGQNHPGMLREPASRLPGMGR